MHRLFEQAKAELLQIESEVIVLPRQKRTRVQMERMLVEGEKLLLANGFEGLTVEEVCRRTDSGQMSFHNRFGTKDRFFAAIQVRYALRTLALVEFMSTQLDPKTLTLPQAVDMFVRLVFTRQKSEGDMFRAFFRYGGTEPAVHRTMVALNKLGRDQFNWLMEPHLEEIRHRDPGVALALAADLLFNLVLLLHLYNPGPLHFDSPGIEDDVIEAMMRILTGRASEGA